MMVVKAKTNKKSYSLNIIDFLKSLDSRDYKRYEKLSEEDKKSISPLIIMRWMSSCWNGDLTRYYVYTVNNYVNMHFWELANHKELQMKLLAMCGMGKPAGHNWIKSNAIKINNKLSDLIRKHFDCSEDEVEIYLNKLSDEDIEEILILQGIDDKEWDSYKKS